MYLSARNSTWDMTEPRVIEAVISEGGGKGTALSMGRNRYAPLRRVLQERGSRGHKSNEVQRTVWLRTAPGTYLYSAMTCLSCTKWPLLLRAAMVRSSPVTGSTSTTVHSLER